MICCSVHLCEQIAVWIRNSISALKVLHLPTHSPPALCPVLAVGTAAPGAVGAAWRQQQERGPPVRRDMPGKQQGTI